MNCIAERIDDQVNMRAMGELPDDEQISVRSQEFHEHDFPLNPPASSARRGRGIQGVNTSRIEKTEF
jgi:hypothetical protein